ncbi:MAG TPA: DUF2793 domain-containing protein [Alphaproteobacteria bacterium]|nr:DUF2793 domain-containing protein [Alphaproteobacteria bacterium]
MERSANLDLPFIMPSQAQKHVTHNEALLVLDAPLHCAVEDRTRGEPPAAPAEGQRHIVAAGATAGWAGRDGEVAAFQDGAWAFYAPAAGMVVFVKEEGVLLLHDGDAFRAPLRRTPMLGVNAQADAARRLTVASDHTLFTHEGAGHRVVVNKQAAEDTASLVLQDGYSGRAEIGLAGDDDLHVKVSADGTAWREAVKIGRTDGALHAAGGLSVTRGTADSHQFGVGSFLNPGGGAGKVTSIIVGKAAEMIQAAQFGFYNDGMQGGAYIINYGDSEFTGGLFVRIGGMVGVGTAAPAERLHVAGNATVDGTVRVGRFTLATLADPATAGAGVLAFVTDAPGGGTLACSDGEEWRKIATDPL